MERKWIHLDPKVGQPLHRAGGGDRTEQETLPIEVAFF